MTGGRRPPGCVVLLLAAALLGPTTGCSRAVPPARAVRAGSSGPAAAAATPTSAQALESLVVTAVPSGLPRMPDDELSPAAGRKSLDDVAEYADDPVEERRVLRDYGFRYGWERFWGTGSEPVTSVFVEQFAAAPGAGAFTADLARNDADHYRAVLHEDPPGFPGGCRLLTVATPQPDVGLAGPAAFAWCAHGVFSVAVTSVAGSVDAARAEVAALVRTQLDRLPG